MLHYSKIGYRLAKLQFNSQQKCKRCLAIARKILLLLFYYDFIYLSPVFPQDIYMYSTMEYYKKNKHLSLAQWHNHKQENSVTFIKVQWLEKAKKV